MKNKTLFLSILIVVSIFGITNFARAVTPTLSISSTGNADSMQINVIGDPNTSVVLFYTSSSSGSQFISIGNTGANGTLLYTINPSAYNIVSNSTAYVKIGGINGQQSSTVTWPYFQNSTNNSGSTFTLSQSSVLLNVGQTSTITASANYLYVLSNSNPSVANINLNSNQITITANTYGSTTANICIVGSTTNCASISIVAQNSTAQQLTFSQNNFSIVSGQSASVTVAGGSGSYIISNNSNSSSIQASLSGAVVTLTATNTSGVAAITICTTNMSNCGIINVNSTAINSNAITFSQTNPVVPLGQSTTVTIYGGVSGSNFYVSSNSNPSLVQANISGNILTLIANASSGISTINVCAFSGSCASLTANVSNVSTGGALSLSQNTVSILAGQSSNIIISGGSTPYNFSSTSTNIFTGNIVGNTLTIYGVNSGSGTASVCASVGCATLNVTINSTNSTSVAPPTFSQNNISLNVGQQSSVYVTGNGNYYVGSNNSSGAVSISINGNTIIATANAIGNASISICQNGGQCSNLYVNVSAPAIITTTPITTTPTVNIYVLPRFLGYGDVGEDVYIVQQFLVKQGLLSANPTGRYGFATKEAIKKFQKLHGINQTGNIGQATKEIISQLLSTPTSVATSTREQQILALQQAIQQLTLQIQQMYGQ